MPRLITLAAVPILGATLLFAACGGGGSEDEPDNATVDFSAEAIAQSQQELQVQLVSSQVGRGQTRLPFGILKPDPNDPKGFPPLVHDAVASARLYQLDGDVGTPAGEYELTPVSLQENVNHKHADGSNHLHNDLLATVYVANLNLGSGNWWGADLTIRIGDEEYDDVKVKFFVADQTSEPAIGAEVPPSKQATVRDVPDIAAIDSSSPPRPELHQMTVAEAIASGRPSVIAFATPAFCQTRFCGPVVDSVVVPLEEAFGDRVNFLHIEPYKLDEARKGRLVAIPQMQEWGLASEPWVFVLDAQGRVAGKFEGIMSEEEVGAVLDELLGDRAASTAATATP